MADYPEIIWDFDIPSERISGYASDLVDEDPVLGREVLGGLLNFAHAMREIPRETFTGLRDFLDYRKVNIANEYIYVSLRIFFFMTKS